MIANPAARSRTIDVIYRHNDNRVIAFTRAAPARIAGLASLNDTAFRQRLCDRHRRLAASLGRLAGSFQQ